MLLHVTSASSSALRSSVPRPILAALPPPVFNSEMDFSPPPHLSAGEKEMGKQPQVQPEAQTTKPGLCKNIKHQEDCQHRQLITVKGGQSHTVTGAR